MVVNIIEVLSNKNETYLQSQCSKNIIFLVRNGFWAGFVYLIMVKDVQKDKRYVELLYSKTN